MLHIKDKSLFSLKILSFQYIKLKLENPDYQEIIHAPEYKNEAYSYHVLARVADIDDSFEQLKSLSGLHPQQAMPTDYQQLVDRCYLLVGTAIGMQETELAAGLSQDVIKVALQQYPASITTGLKKIESVAKRCRITPCNDNDVSATTAAVRHQPVSLSQPCGCIQDLHQSVAALQVSLADVFSMKLQRLH